MWKQGQRDAGYSVSSECAARGHEPEMWEASAGCKRQETNSPLEPVGGPNLADTCFKPSETHGRLLTYRTVHEYTCM